MIHDRRHALARLLAYIVQAVLPRHLKPWGQALAHEVATIADGGEALRHAWGGFYGLVPRAMLFHLSHGMAIVAGAAPDGGPDSDMGAFGGRMWRRPRLIGLACAIGAVLLGLIHMALAGAPPRYLGINAAALVIGLSLLVLLDSLAVPPRTRPGRIMLAMSLLLPATALFGTGVEGAARWVAIGPLFIQPSLVLIPPMLVRFARCRSLAATMALAIAALAMALQPDRAMAGALVAGLATLTLYAPCLRAKVALACSIAAFVATLAQPDRLPAMPHVDQIFYTAFAVHPLAGIAVLGGSMLLIVPAMAGQYLERDAAPVHLTFGAVWAAIIAAAALGNYPTPMVGYSGAAVLGYMLSLAMLPRRAAVDSAPLASAQADGPDAPDRQERIAACPA